MPLHIACKYTYAHSGFWIPHPLFSVSTQQCQQCQHSVNTCNLCRQENRKLPHQDRQQQKKYEMEFDPIETCPYDAVHRIRRSRMQFHIITCSKNFPASKMMQCPFDARHRINQVEFEYHKNHCPARESVLNYALHDPTPHSEPKILPISVEAVGEADENWDDGPTVKSYNPLQAIKDKPIVYSVIGLSKAKRKEHRMQQRLRFNQIMEKNGNQNPNEVQTNALSKQSLPIKETAEDDDDDDVDEQEYKPLRRPHAKKTNDPPQNKNPSTARSIPEKSNKSQLKVDGTQDSLPNYKAAVLKTEKAPSLRRPKVEDSIVDKLSRTFEEFVVNDEDHKKKNESLDEQINLLKKKPTRKVAKEI